MVRKMYNDDPFLGITKQMPLFDSTIYPIVEGKFIEIQLLKKRNEKYYEVIFHDEQNLMRFGKFSKDNNLLGVKYKNGKVLLYNENFNHEKRKMNIVEVLALYNIDDDIFYYCSEEEAIRMFDDTIDLTGLISPTKKILRTQIRKQILDDSEVFEIKNFYSIKKKENLMSDEIINDFSNTPKVLKLIK